MPLIKKRRTAVRIDMTPMVDVAFLLLTFFMLTTQFQPPEEVEIILPMSHSPVKLPESNVTTIMVNKEGKIFMGFDSQYMMENVFGSGQRLKKSVEIKLEALADLLIKARINNSKLRTVIKGDANADFGVVADIIDVLQKNRVIRFAMVTNLDAQP